MIQSEKQELWFVEITERAHGHNFYIGEVVKINLLDGNDYSGDNPTYSSVNKYGYWYSISKSEFKNASETEFNKEVAVEDKRKIIGRLAGICSETTKTEYCRHTNKVIVVAPHPTEYGMYEVEHIVTLERRYENMHDLHLSNLIRSNGDWIQFKGSWQERFYLERKYGNRNMLNNARVWGFVNKLKRIFE